MNPGEDEWQYEIFTDILREGIKSHKWSIESLSGKAKSALAAGAIVLSIMMGGLGGSSWLFGGSTSNIWQFLGTLPAWTVVIIIGSGVCSLGVLSLSIYYSMNALKVIKLSGFVDARTFMAIDGSDNSNKEEVAKWLSASKQDIYERVHDAHILELASLEKHDARMGKDTKLGQRCLFIGLVLGVIMTITLLFAPLSV